jgi:Icc-related predicted phosphoesterase
MVLMVIADDDGLVKNISGERADVLVSCGDLGDQTILTVRQAVGCRRVFAVKGNHDSGGPFSAPITDLHLLIQECGGLRFGGFNGSWRYKPRGHFLYEQDEVERQLAVFPPADVFVAHNSPRHLHDRDDEVHIGFEAFNSYIRRVQPLLFLHGHQHLNQEALVGRTRVVGIYGVRTFNLSADAIP